jgi:hypothetical protein
VIAFATVVDHAVPLRLGLYVQVTPSGDVATAPFAPTAQYWESDLTMAFAFVIPKTAFLFESPFWYVQVMPSGDVAHVPISPAIQNWVPVQVIAFAELPVPHAVVLKPV